MCSVAEMTLESNTYHKLNFSGGDLSSDSGLLLFKEFICKMGFDLLLKDLFHTDGNITPRLHTEDKNLLQVLYQIMSAYFTDDCADELTKDPVFTAMLGKNTLASQPTLSRFFSHMDKDTLERFDLIAKELRKRVYTYNMPDMILMDLDSTLLETYGKQEGEGYNVHYHAHGYHPLVCFDSLTGDLLRIQLREGTKYSCNGVTDFLKPLLDEFQNDYPAVQLFLRADSGFATPELYTQCETNGVSYVIRLKENSKLHELATYLDEELSEITKRNVVDYAVVYGEFLYQAGSWDYPRRVVCKIEKPTGQMVHLSTFILTNMDLPPVQLIKLYCNRGSMENLIKEGKSGFDFAGVSSRLKVVNANRLQIHALAYNLFNWFRRLALPKEMRKHMIDTIRLRLFKIAARVVRSARYITFKLCSSYPYKREFLLTLENIRQLKPRLA